MNDLTEKALATERKYTGKIDNVLECEFDLSDMLTSAHFAQTIEP